MEALKIYLRTLNLFDRNNTEETQHEYTNNLIATRIYLILLAFFLILICIFTVRTQQTAIMSIQNITKSQFESIGSLNCPCSRTSLLYGDFANISNFMHPICSSDFITQRWIESLYFHGQTENFLPMDIRFASYTQFQVLIRFCEISSTVVRQNILKLQLTPFINTYLLSKSDLQAQVQGIFIRFQLTVPYTFQIQMDLIESMLRNNILLSATGADTFFLFTTQLQDNRIRVSSQFYVDSDHIACFCTSNPQCTGLSGIYHNVDDPSFSYLPFILTPGLTSGCSRVYSTLASSLECFFNQTCLDSFNPYLNSSYAFTALNISQMFYSFNTTSVVKTILGQLMTDYWLINISYDKYFSQCAPNLCTYLQSQAKNFKVVLNTLIGVLGGLCTGLGIIVPLVVHRIRRPKANTVASAVTTRPRITVMDRIRNLKNTLVRSIVELNLFQTEPDDFRQHNRQRLITRIYILLLLIILLAFSLYTSLSLDFYQETILKPSETQFIVLHAKYSTSVNCPCSNVSILYGQFINITPIYHQICTSDFISQQWFQWLSFNAIQDGFYLSFRVLGRYYFRMLSALCQISKRTITNSLALFLQEQLVTTQVISKDLFDSQVSTFILAWHRTTTYTIIRAVNIMQAAHQGNHLIGTHTNFNGTIGSADEVIISSSNRYGVNCSCLFSNLCRAPIGVYDDMVFLETGEVKFLFNIPGFSTGCVGTEALLSSTLECFYDVDCLQTLNGSLQVDNNFLIMGNFRPLDTSLSQVNQTVQSMLDRLFVEQWIEEISFLDYYQACAPPSCTFEYVRRRDFMSVVLMIVAIFGGLNTGLKIFLSIVLRLMNKIWLDQTAPDRLLLVKNWFLDWHREQYFHHRMRIIFLIVGLIALVISSVISEVYRIEQVSKPSFATYKELTAHFPYNLRCPCAQASIPYHYFLNYTVSKRHQICSSDFITDRWIHSLTFSDDPSRNSQYDYRTIAVGHFEFLSFLCQLTEQHINQSLMDLHTTMLISSQIIPISDFYEYFRATLFQFQQTTYDTFIVTLQLAHDIIASNGYLTLFQTNWKFRSPVDSSRTSFWIEIPTEPLTYDDCNCAMSSDCTQPAMILNQSIPGFMMGCYPLGSLLQSTLECLYDIACFSKILSTNNAFHPLNRSNPSRYSINATVANLLTELMIEDWTSNISYEQYYTQCAPLSCSYTHLSPSTLPEIVSNLLGLYGGLMIITQVFIIIVIGLWKHVIYHRYRRMRVEPFN